mgnify:FL=1
MQDIHEVKLSYKTVENYSLSIIHPLLEFYHYELSDTIAANETYIKILGKTNISFFTLMQLRKLQPLIVFTKSVTLYLLSKLLTQL